MKNPELQLPQLPDPTVSFIASLSNGETIVEGKGDYSWEPGLKSPWNRLIRYSAEKKLTITSVSLFTPGGATYTLPPSGGKPRFNGFTNLTAEEQPIDFEVKRFIAQEMNVGIHLKKTTVENAVIAEFYTIAEAIYKDHVLQLWVDELNTRHSWVVSRKI